MSLLIRSLMLAQSAGQQATEAAKKLTDNRAYSSEVSRQFNDGKIGPMLEIRWIMIAGGLLIMIFAAIGLWKWWRYRHQRTRPLHIYLKAARKAGLNWKQISLLSKIAKYTGISTPLSLMVSSDTLVFHAKVYAEARNIRRINRFYKDVDDIAGILFSGYVKGEISFDEQRMRQMAG